MFSELNKIIDEKLNADVLIIGCGTTAIYIAERLKNSNKKIIMIEKGGLKNYQKNNNTKKLMTFPSHSGFKKNISIGVGGNSTLWGGQLVEFEKNDFKKCYWGFNFLEIKKLYKKVYDFFGVNKIKLHDFLNFTNQKNFRRKNIQSFYTQWLKEPNFKKLFFENLKEKKYQIFLNTEIMKFKFKKKKCEYVEIKSKNIIKRIYPKTVILCAGTFGNIEIMQKHKKNSPWKNNNVIGKYFQDHLGLFIGKIKLANKQKFNNVFLNGFIGKDKYQPKIKAQYRFKNFTYGISGEIKTLKETETESKFLREFYYEKSFVSFFNLFKLLKYLNFDLFRKIFHFLVYKKILFTDYKKLFFYVQCEQKPIPSSKLYFDQSKKEKKLNLNWKIEGDELKIIKRFVNDVNYYFHQNGIGKIECKILNKLNINHFKKNLRDTNHPSGGLLISNHKNKGVVDKNLKVWNTSNVFVNGSVTFPCSSHANITLTSLALSEKLASYIKKNY